MIFPLLPPLARGDGFSFRRGEGARARARKSSVMVFPCAGGRAAPSLLPSFLEVRTDGQTETESE